MTRSAFTVALGCCLALITAAALQAQPRPAPAPPSLPPADAMKPPAIATVQKPTRVIDVSGEYL